MKKQIYIVLTMLIIVTVTMALGFNYDDERGPIFAGISDNQKSIELDILDLDLCGVNIDIVEINTNIVSVTNYTTYNFTNINGTIFREMYNVSLNNSVYKIPLFPNATVFAYSDYTFSDLGFGEINDTIVPFIEEDYYSYSESADPIENVTYAYVYRPIHDNNIVFNETSIIVGNNTLNVTKTGWYQILYENLNLSLNDITPLLINISLIKSLVYLEENDFITSKYLIESTLGNFPNLYFGYESGYSDIEFINGCRRLVLEYTGT